MSLDNHREVPTTDAELGRLWQFWSPTRVVFGEGCIDRLAEHVDFARRVLVVTGKGSAQRHGHAARVDAALESMEQVVWSTNISPNPRLSEVEAAAAVGLDVGVDCVIGLGGGSAMDAAKGVAVAVALNGQLADHFRQGLAAPSDTLPVVCVPTTAGTGSETSKGAILSDAERGVKNGLRGEALLPRVAVVDPELTYSVPQDVTAETGFDIFTHAVETWVSRKAGPWTGLFSRHAIGVVVDWLPRLLEDLGDREARRELSMASTLMGYNLANSSTCLPHRMQYPVGALTDTSHPAGLAALYPAWCENTASAAPEIFDYLSLILDAGSREGVSRRMAEFLESLGIARNLGDLGVREDQVDELAESVSGDVSVDPGPSSTAAMADLYRRAWRGSQ